MSSPIPTLVFASQLPATVKFCYGHRIHVSLRILFFNDTHKQNLCFCKIYIGIYSQFLIIVYQLHTHVALRYAHSPLKAYSVRAHDRFVITEKSLDYETFNNMTIFTAGLILDKRLI